MTSALTLVQAQVPPAREHFAKSAALSQAREVDDPVDQYIKGEMHRRHIAGLSLAVIKNSKILKAKGYGLANVETATPATPETVYKIGSLSKQFLAVAILLLAQDERLHLDDKISKYLDGTPATWKDITIRHLLTHTSGLVEDPPGFEPFKTRPDADIIRAAYSAKLLFVPGEKFSYSNLGYFLIAEIIHKVSGKPWSGFVSERVLAPAGMATTRTTTTTDIVPHRASGYLWNNGKLENAENWVAVRPSGAYLSTVLDMARWNEALCSGAILSPSMRDQMWTPVKLNNGKTYPYGFGWNLGPWQGHKRVYHDGELPGFDCDFERFVDDEVTVIVMFNTMSADPKKIALHIAGLYVPALASPVASKSSRQ
jgi:CubicO group peptidase (beta-lactamase class C family)